MEPMLLIGIILVGGAIALGLWAVLSSYNEKAMVRESLKQLEGYEVENVRDQELLAPITDRALVPVLKGLTSVGRRFTPVGYVDNGDDCDDGEPLANPAQLAELCDGDPARFTGMEGRFSSPVMPGEALTISIWRTGDGEAVFQTAGGDGRIVLDAGRATFA